VLPGLRPDIGDGRGLSFSKDRFIGKHKLKASDRQQQQLGDEGSRGDSQLHKQQQQQEEERNDPLAVKTRGKAGFREVFASLFTDDRGSAVHGALAGTTVMMSGLFPEVGGRSSGLRFGKTTKMMESFGGRVARAISRKPTFSLVMIRASLSLARPMALTGVKW
jgi:hypothetical protein